MPDQFSSQKRSEIMASIRSKNSKAEKLTFSYLRKENIYFQKHYKRAPGTPDIALPRKKRAVFIDGDFWHGRNYEEIMRRPNPMNEYWSQKIIKNAARDGVNNKLLKTTGWKVLRIWESDINRKRTQQKQLKDIAKFLRAST